MQIMDDRYSRNRQVPNISNEGQEKISNAKILVCGAGGLGSTVIANLASLGVGTIGVIDSDVVEITNLNRQFLHTVNALGKSKVDSANEWIKNFNPDINVKTYNTRLDEKNFAAIVNDYDLIVDCFDSFESKFLLNKIAILTQKTLIHGGVSEWSGQVMVLKPQKPCLECVFGKFKKGEPPKGVTSPIVSTIASIQSTEALKIILGLPTFDGLLSFDGLSMKFKTLIPQKNPKCECSKY